MMTALQNLVAKHPTGIDLLKQHHVKVDDSTMLFVDFQLSASTKYDDFKHCSLWNALAVVYQTSA